MHNVLTSLSYISQSSLSFTFVLYSLSRPLLSFPSSTLFPVLYSLSRPLLSFLSSLPLYVNMSCSQFCLQSFYPRSPELFKGRDQGLRGTNLTLSSVEGLYGKRSMQCLASSKLLTPHPLTACGEGVPPPPPPGLGGGGAHPGGGGGGGGGRCVKPQK
jgi:hypothetical protein